MIIKKMHFTNQNKKDMVLVTFTDDDGGNTTSSVFTLAGWTQIEEMLQPHFDKGIKFEDES